MGLFSRIKDFFRGNRGIGEVEPMPLQEGHELKLEETPNQDEEVQTTFNTDSLDELVEEGVVENVEFYNEN